MNILLSNKSELHIYTQMKEKIKEKILNSTIQEGEMITYIGKPAKETGASVIATTRAYNVWSFLVFLFNTILDSLCSG